MELAFFIKVALAVNVILICGCGQAQRFEGSPCTLSDGSRGTCKNVARCESIIEGIRLGTLRYDDIVGCSFMGTVQIACCADERPTPGRYRPPPPSRPTQSNTDFVFVTTPPPRRVTQNPSSGTDTFSRYSPGTKAESACEKYSVLPVAISWNILGGIPTYRGEFPWMVALGYVTNGGDINFDCGGTLISDNFVLTAAHCSPPRRQPRLVRLGKVTLFTNDDDGQPVDINIQEIIRHPDYKSATKKNDIALIRLAQRVQFSENIRPACIRTELADIRPDTEMIVTGWGTISAERTVRPSVLLKTNVTSMPLQLCNTTLLNYNRDANQASLRSGIGESQCCAFDPMARNDACQGDSGGPLQIFQSANVATIVGIVSFGISCGTSLPGVYTRVAYYLDWIESNVWPN